MAEKTNIAWTDSTWNPWVGCAKVSPGCTNCYAEVSTPSRTMGVAWGPHEARRRTKPGNWQLPRRWNAGHAQFFAEHGRRRRVFCASLADVFDNAVDPVWRADLWALIQDTPHLDWLLLTKRIGNVPAMLPASWRAGWPNVWLGISVVNQDEADRDVAKLLRTPAARRWLSMEPLLGPVDLRSVLWPGAGTHRVDVLSGGYWNVAPYLACARSANLGEPKGGFTNHSDMPATIDWVIVGGESGPHARPMDPSWARSLRDQCQAADVPFLFKQIGGSTKDKGGCLLDALESKAWPESAVKP